MSIDVVQMVRDGKGYFEWAEVLSEHAGHKLWISVSRDALKFDGIPPCTWRRVARAPLAGEQATYDGVRLPMSANEMQQVCDLLSCMMPTPKILDLIWQQADMRFDPVINVNGRIVAESDIHLVHNAIEKKIASAPGDSSGLIDNVGKYWVLSNRLQQTPQYGVRTACNYGWHSSNGASSAVTPKLHVWQAEGTRHDDRHADPSQVWRGVYRLARHIDPHGNVALVDLHTIAKSPELAPLINHNGVLRVLRQPSVPEPQPVIHADGSMEMPLVLLNAAVPPAELEVTRRRPAA